MLREPKASQIKGRQVEEIFGKFSHTQILHIGNPTVRNSFYEVADSMRFNRKTRKVQEIYDF